MNRPRNKGNKGLPPNLYTVGEGYYRYRHPQTGKFHGMGNDKADAVKAAKHLNGLLMVSGDKASKVLGVPTLDDHIQWMRDNVLPEREYAESTLEMYEVRFKQMGMLLDGRRPVDEITIQNISEIRETLTPRVWNQFRQVAVDVFKSAMSRGLCPDNPAEIVPKRKEKKTRQRWTEAQYKDFYEAAPQWLKNACDLALITLQRREDITLLEFANCKDGYLYVIQEKTKKYDTGYLRIEIGKELAKVISRCRDNTPSPYLVHRAPARRIRSDKREHWTQVMPEMISREVKRVTGRLDCMKAVPEAERPTFHELRALGIKRYKDKGYDPQQLAGHASDKMTSNYDAGHEDIRWVDVKSD